MTELSLAGRVVRSTDYEPIAGARVRLTGPAAAIGGLPGARPLEGLQISWTRTLSGFGGDLYDCWEAHLRETIGWPEFRAAARDYNPHLDADEPRFEAELVYTIPEADLTPRAEVEVTSDEQGRYRIELGETPFAGELRVSARGYQEAHTPVVVNGQVVQPAALNPRLESRMPAVLGEAEATPLPTSAPGSVRSALPNYAALPRQIQLVIDWGLFMLGDDQAVFDALPAHLQKMCHGSRYLADPGHRYHKDICCADLVSVVLKAAGCDISWSSQWGPSAAQYYYPEGNDKLVEVPVEQGDWRPGDILVYGPHTSDPKRQAGHVNLYVGPFSGTDRSGVAYALGGKFEVIDASIDFPGKDGKEMGTSVKGRDLAVYCLQKKAWTYKWVRRVRLRELGV
ncbi:MAG TPA: hypothetical protein VNL77_14795 [Roseiflexaceae bacterium]|nr:hypothetical protein [Roseiflexaceae bacterium]